jgi:hypothetical protein
MSVDDIYTKSLLHFEGDDGSGSFIDESKKPWYPYVVQIDDAQKKFGNTSGIFAAGVIKTPNHTDWYLGSTDFTIDFWVKSTQTTQYATLISNSPRSWGAGMWSLLTSNSNAGDNVCPHVFFDMERFGDNGRTGPYSRRLFLPYPT